MKTLEKDLFELLDDKLSGELSGEELEAFDMDLADDPELMAEFELHQEIDEAIQESEVIELRKKLDLIHDLTQNKKQPGLLRTILRHKLSRIAAASFVVLLIITSLSLNLLRPADHNMSNESLFKIYYQPDAAMLIRGNNSQDETIIKAFQLYENQEYSTALDLFSEVLQTDIQNMPIQFYSGISSIELGQYQAALIPFNYIMDHNSNLYVERAEWYAALCHLKLNEKKSAVDLFTQISMSSSFYKDKAHEILKSIEN